MADCFERIGLVSRKGSRQVTDTLVALAAFLRARGAKLILESETHAVLGATVDCEQVCDRERLGEYCDLVIVVGGDGSMLGVARALCRQSIPVLGINRGSLGFLTDIAPDEIEQRVSDVLSGRYTLEERFLLEAHVERNGVVLAEGDALNEVVLHRGASLRMIEFALYLDGHFVYSQHSDGLIVSTPTGSTAYALSGGGPILHPALDAISLVPMFPHTLTSRPIVVAGQSQLRIVLGEPGAKAESGGGPELSCDGQMHIALQAGDVVHMRKKQEKLQLVHPLDHDYYETCRTKLGWGSRLV
ncbi:MAG: NAD(+) kinase [Pseudomonadales bacterium]|jgi:NAD+ kinase|nr:NAD(+) kinase [Pseudomonadales bacterium]